MKMIRSLIVVFVSIPCNLALAARPIENLIDVPFPTIARGAHADIEQVKRAIMSGCRKSGWMPLIDDQRQVSCSTLVRSKYYAEVEIPYTETSYSIYYKSSRELDYDEKRQRIHSAYNRWVTLLSDAIRRAFADE